MLIPRLSGLEIREVTANGTSSFSVPGAPLSARMPAGQLGHTARQEGGQRREAAGEPSPAREARERTAGIEPATLSLGS
jgi:hypothetical protein